MVLYNIVLVVARADQNPVLFIDGQQLLPFCYNPLQLALIALFGHSVPFSDPENPGKCNLLPADNENGGDDDNDDDVVFDGGAKQNQFVLDSREVLLLIE
ncbi:hypothetical protein OCU04_000177 [Sclerotinia nivalis]|uniref:Uncharacterized protein n=1 Tax=Sclerotinia nivalis TaxID=352851 RepID=A0A9X0DNH0_9HELO|nr:hypothetical protein OCU04_000177 [Sclerotinia nivalis]